jgi:hypothetical protein
MGYAIRTAENLLFEPIRGAFPVNVGVIFKYNVDGVVFVNTNVVVNGKNCVIFDGDWTVIS